MKTFKQLVTEVAQPRGEDEKRFKDKHVVAVTDDPQNGDKAHKATTSKKKRQADTEDDEGLYEETMKCEECGEEYDSDDEHECESMEEAAQPKWTVSFKSKHPSQTVTGRNTAEAIKKASERAKPHGPGNPIYKEVKKLAEEMTPAQEKKREEIVLSMKDKKDEFKKRYGDKWKSVMYATATKNAIKEAKAYVSSISPKFGEKGSHDVIGKDGKIVKSFPYSKEGMKAAQKHLYSLKESVELDEAVNVKAIQKAVDDGKSMDAIMTMFANKRTTNTDEIRKVVKDYMWKKRMKKEEVEIEEALKPMPSEADDIRTVNSLREKRRTRELSTKEKGQLARAENRLRSRGHKLKESVELGEAVIDTLNDIVKNKSMKSVKFADGRKLRVDLTTASALVQVHNKLNDKNKTKFADAINKNEDMFMKMVDFSFSGGKK
jgi:hypothetical protein